MTASRAVHTSLDINAFLCLSMYVHTSQNNTEPCEKVLKHNPVMSKKNSKFLFDKNIHSDKFFMINLYTDE